MQRDETPLPFSFSEYTGNSSAAQIDSLVNKIQEYGYLTRLLKKIF